MLSESKVIESKLAVAPQEHVGSLPPDHLTYRNACTRAQSIKIVTDTSDHAPGICLQSIWEAQTPHLSDHTVVTDGNCF